LAVSWDLLDRTERAVAGGARLLTGGKRISGAGNFFEATVLADIPKSCAMYYEEIFGPVAYIIPFHDEDEAVTTVNRSRYGLANSVWSADLNRAERVAERLVAGNTWVNAHNVFAYGLPYGGVNLSGYGGGVNSPETLMDYLRPQTIARPLR